MPPLCRNPACCLGGSIRLPGGYLISPIRPECRSALRLVKSHAGAGINLNVFSTDFGELSNFGEFEQFFTPRMMSARFWRADPLGVYTLASLFVGKRLLDRRAKHVVAVFCWGDDMVAGLKGNPPPTS